MDARTDQVLIIGAGPAGLATAGRLRKAGIPFRIIEQHDRIGWSWHNHYDRLCLHTVRELSALPHLPFPGEYPRFVPRKLVADYLIDYAAHFRIEPDFGQEVERIDQTPSGSWTIRTRQGREYRSDRIVLATGFNRVPFAPTWPGMEQFAGDILHSRAYRNPDPYLGKRVLVVGMGNTGAEIALDLAEKGIHPWISVRSPINVVPREINGRPTQLTGKLLEKLPFGLGDWLGVQIRKIVVGDLSRYGLQTAQISPAKQLRDTGKTPVIDLGTIDQIRAGNIRVVGDIDRFTANGVILENEDTLEVDSLILATGYRPKLESFFREGQGLFNDFGVPDGPIGKGPLKGLYFVGFDNFKLGGILGTIYEDSATVTDHIHQAIQPTSPPG